MRLFLVALLVAVLSGLARAQPEPSPSPVPLAEIAVEAESVFPQLEARDHELSNSGEIQEIEEKLPPLVDEIDARFEETGRLLAGNPALESLRSAEANWTELANSLVNWKRLLTERGAALEKRAKELDELDDHWADLEQQCRDQQAPAEQIARIEELRAALARSHRLTTQQRAETLKLLNAVIAQDARIQKALGQLSRVRVETVSRIFSQDSPPIWSAAPTEPLSHSLLDSFVNQFTELSAYANRQLGSFMGHILLLAMLVLAFAWAHREVVPWVEAEPKLARTAEVFRAPFATALVLSVLLTRVLYPQAPAILSALMGAVALVPAIYLLRRLLKPYLFGLLYALVVFYLIDLLRSVVAPLQTLPRVLFLTEMVAAILFLLWLRRARTHASLGKWESRFVRVASGLALALFIVALCAGALGFSALGYLLGNGVLQACYLGVLLYAAVQIFDGLVMLALRTRPLRLLGVVRHHRPVMRRRTTNALRLLAVLAWIWLVLEAFSLRAPLFAALTDLGQRRIGLGAVSFSLGDLVAFGLVIWASFLVSRLLRFFMEEDVYTRVNLPRGLPYALSTLLHYSILLVGFLVAIAALGIDTTRFAILAGAFGVGLGLGLQNVVNNFVSGLILLFERPVKVGDMVEVEGVLGSLNQIGLRSSVLRTVQGADIIIPNGDLMSSKVTNWTLADQKRRVEVDVGVEYGTSPRQVCELLTEVAKGHPQVLQTPSPQTLFEGFGDNSLNFQVRAWTLSFDHWQQVRSELAIAVYEALEKAEIGIPFPQRVLHLDKDLKTFLERTPVPKGRTARKRTSRDAPRTDPG